MAISPYHAIGITLHIFHFLNKKVTVLLKSPIGAELCRTHISLCRQLGFQAPNPGHAFLIEISFAPWEPKISFVSAQVLSSCFLVCPSVPSQAVNLSPLSFIVNVIASPALCFKCAQSFDAPLQCSS